MRSKASSNSDMRSEQVLRMETEVDEEVEIDTEKQRLSVSQRRILGAREKSKSYSTVKR